MEYVYGFGSGWRGWRRGWVDKRIGFRLYQSCGNRGVGWGDIMSVRVASSDYLCRWQVQVQVSVYCSWRIPAHLRCTQCSILLHIMDICFLPCICLWQISQIQICLCVVV